MFAGLGRKTNLKHLRAFSPLGWASVSLPTLIADGDSGDHRAIAHKKGAPGRAFGEMA